MSEAKETIMQDQPTLFDVSVIVQRHQTCARCNRPLKNTLSMERGYGAVCYAKVMAERQDMKSDREFADKPIVNTPLTQMLVCKREGGETFTNVPHLVTHHSPTGFEWGYGGSGPADLALNVVEFTLRNIGFDGQTFDDVWDDSEIFRQSWAMHQSFKFEFIARIPKVGGTVPYALIEDWVRDHLQEEDDEDALYSDEYEGLDGDND